MKRITAKFEGTCSGCNEPIHQGMDIYWEKRVGAFHISCWERYRGNEGSNTGYKEQAYNDYRETDISVPVFLQAREKYKGYQVRFYESLAVPDEVLEAINLDVFSRDELKGHTQWRLDFPIGSRTKMTNMYCFNADYNGFENTFGEIRIYCSYC